MSKALIFNNKVVDIVDTEFEVAPTMTWMDCTAECATGWTLIDGVLTAPAAVSLTYSEARVLEYPTLGDQLDMIYHNGDGGATFQAAIKAVKDKYPK